MFNFFTSYHKCLQELVIWRWRSCFGTNTRPSGPFCLSQCLYCGFKRPTSFLPSFFHPLPRIKYHFAKEIYIHIITSLSISIGGVCESHKQIICPLDCKWIDKYHWQIAAWLKKGSLYSFKMGLEFLIRAKATLSSFGDSCASPSSTLLCSRAKDGVIVSWWDNQRVERSPVLNSPIIVIDWAE